jgi:hypothetical protein
MQGWLVLLYSGTESSVAIYRLLQNSAFGPDEAERMCVAYERALATLGLIVPSDTVARNLAKLIIETAQTGEKDPKRICAAAVKLMDDKDQVQPAC